MTSMAFHSSRSILIRLRSFRPNISSSTHISTSSVSQIRYQSRFPNPGGYRRQTQYNRFSRAQSIKYLWQTSRGFRYGVGTAGTGAVGFVAVNMETVPVSGRRRFNWVSPAREEKLGLTQFEQVRQEFQGRILPAWHPNTKMVQRVLDRLIPNSGLEGQAWEIYVIDDPKQMNAFVIPGSVLHSS